MSEFLTRHTGIDMLMASEINAAYFRAAEHHLRLFREALAQFNLSRHRLKYKRHCGVLCLHVNDHLWFEMRTSDAPVMQAIVQIGDLLDLAENTWAPQLEGVTIWPHSVS